MCQLLGICANQEVDITFSFREWRHRGDIRNPHGYGFSYWEGAERRVVKAASSLYNARSADTEVVTAARSRMFLAHVRLKSVGPQDGNNTHPFVASAFGKEFAFAHNGTVGEIKKRPLQRRKPAGKTDSEHAFLLILEGLEGLGEAPDGSSFAERLQDLAAPIRTLGRFNFLLSDGLTLWAYADDSLHFIERTPPYGGQLVQLVDDGYSMDLCEVKGLKERAVLLATKPLTNEAGWQELNAGELMVVRDGIVRKRLGR